MRISAVIVNYNSGRMLSDCITSLRGWLNVGEGADEIVVVDNMSTDGSMGCVPELPGIKVVNKEANLGYGGGCNEGFEHTSGEILLFMNPDIRLLTPVTTVRLAFGMDPYCAVVAPGIIEDGRLCDSLRPFPAILYDMLGELGMDRPFRPLRRTVTGSTPLGVNFSGFSTGAAMFVRRDAFVKVGRFDGSFFMYYEETDLFKRLSDEGYRFVYTPTCLVEHASGGSSGSLGWKKTAIRYNSKLRYFSKHSSRVGLRLHRTLTLAVATVKYFVFSAADPLTAARQRGRAHLYAIRLYRGLSMDWTPWTETGHN